MLLTPEMLNNPHAELLLVQDANSLAQKGFSVRICCEIPIHRIFRPHIYRVINEEYRVFPN